MISLRRRLLATPLVAIGQPAMEWPLQHRRSLVSVQQLAHINHARAGCIVSAFLSVRLPLAYRQQRQLGYCSSQGIRHHQ